jgi:MarR family multiple antibiotic resistance transcriptional regulator
MVISKPADELIDDDDYRLYRLLLRTSEIVSRVRTRELNELSDYGITSSQVGILFATKILGKNATGAKISRFLHRNPNTISELLVKMEKKGLIKKITNPHNKKGMRIAITDKGLEAFQVSINRRSVHRIFYCLSAEEHSQLEQMLTKVLSNALEEFGANIKK